MDNPSPRLVSVGTGAIQNLRSFVSRSAKVSGPITAACGAIADLASTIGAFSFYLFILSLLTAVTSGFLWFARYRRDFLAAAANGNIDPAEAEALGEHNVWSITFAFSVVASVVMGGFVLAAHLSGSPDKGVIASTVPGMDQLQASLFRVEKKLDDVKTDTAAIKTDTTALRTDTAAVKDDTTRIAASVEEIAKRFDSIGASTRGLVPNPKTPEEHYHNARIHELGGNFSAARKSYTDYLAFNLEMLDPWQNYAGMLKAQEGRAGALETIRYFGDKLDPKTVSYQTVVATLEEGEARSAKLQQLATDHSDFGPLAWLASQEFSEARKGEQTLADKRKESEWLEKFRAANAAGKFDRYFIDKKESQKWVDAADARWAKLASTPAKVLANPVTLSAQQSNSGWAVIFGLADFRVKELFYKLDGEGEFRTTGHLPQQNPQTGLPMVNTHVPLPNLASGEHTMEVQYKDKDDQLNGPYTLKFTTEDQQLSQGKQMVNATAGSWLMFRDFNGKVLLYFTQLMSYRPVIKEVRYSINSDALDKVFKFKPSKTMFEPGDDLYLTVPKESQFAMVQVTFKDGTISSPQKIMRSR